jgi:anti-anti-sigma factor
MDYETPDMLVRVQDHVTIVRLTSRNVTSVGDVGRITAALNNIVDEDSRRLIVDFKNVHHVSSSTLGMLIALRKKMSEIGGKLIISHPEQIDELLRVSHTHRLFEFAPDSKAAFKMLKPDASAS